MKNLFAILPILLFCSCATDSGKQVSHEGILPQINAPQTLQLLGETFTAGDSASEEDKCLVKYYRPGENEKAWKKTLSLRLNETGLTSLQMVEHLESSVTTGKASAVRSFKDKATSGYGIEFTLITPEFLELDVYRFADRTNGMGTISFQYSERIPSEQLRAIGEAKMPEYYGTMRSKVVKAIEGMPMPKIDKVSVETVK